MKFVFACVPVAGLLLAGTATAQSMGAQTMPEAAPAPSGEAFITMQESNQTMASEMMGMSAVGPDGESIGKVSDLLITQENQIVGVVVTMGGMLGLGGKDVAIPLDAVTFQVHDEKQVVMLPQTKEALENAPEFKTLAEQRDEQRRMQNAPATGATPPAGAAR